MRHLSEDPQRMYKNKQLSNRSLIDYIMEPVDIILSIISMSEEVGFGKKTCLLCVNIIMECVDPLEIK